MPVGLLNEIQLPTCEWEEIIMEFVVGMPQTLWQNYFTWVVMDKLT